MKIKPEHSAAFIAKPTPGLRMVLLYGPDTGQIADLARRIAQTVVANLNDPFQVSELTGAALKDDPARLIDEAAALSMTGGRRVVRVRDVTDTLTPVFKRLLDDTTGEALTVVTAGELGKTSSLRKLFEDAKNTVAIGCYGNEGNSLDAEIVETLRGFGLTAEPDAITSLREHLGGDFLLTRRELEKLALYVGGNSRTVTLDDVQACVTDATALSLDDLMFAVTDGDQRQVQKLLDRLYAEGVSPIAILRILARHLQRLHLATGAVAAGHSIDQAVSALKPPVFFKRATQFRTQVRAWPTERVWAALDRLTTAEMDCKTTGFPAEAICARTLLQVAAAGRKR